MINFLRRFFKKPRTDFLKDVEDFHKAFGAYILPDEAKPSLMKRATRMRLLLEEIEELEEAVEANDLVEVADAYADIVYIVLGSALSHIGKERFIKVWDEVHRTNMTKLVNGKPILREDGKILKPEGWQPPNIKDIVENWRGK